MPTVPATLFCSESDVQSLLSDLGVDLRTDDLDAGGRAAFFARATAWATQRVQFHCQGLYDAPSLAASYLVNEWATVLATYFACVRRGNPAQMSIRELLYGAEGTEDKGVMGDLEEVRAGRAQIPDVGQRNGSGLAWSNVTVDPRYRLRQIRVQRPISERTPTQGYTQSVDQSSENAWEF
jgi:hypothetical protein